MKKVLFLLPLVVALLVFSGCSDDEENSPVAGSYQITNLVEKYSDGVLNGTLYDCVVVEFDENNEVIKQDYVGSISYGGGTSNVIEADPSCRNIVVTFFYLPNDSEYEALNERYVIAQLFEIRSGDTALVYVREDTKVVSISDLSVSSLTKSISDSVEFSKMIELIHAE